MNGPAISGLILAVAAHVPGVANLAPSEGLTQKVDRRSTPRAALPSSEELRASIAEGWTPPQPVATWAERLDEAVWTKRMNDFVDKVANTPPRHPAVAHWRTLVLFYPNTDTDYFNGGTSPDL